jgi:hypothetical protein
VRRWNELVQEVTKEVSRVRAPEFFQLARHMLVCREGQTGRCGKTQVAKAHWSSFLSNRTQVASHSCLPKAAPVGSHPRLDSPMSRLQLV